MDQSIKAESAWRASSELPSWLCPVFVLLLFSSSVLTASHLNHRRSLLTTSLSVWQKKRQLQKIAFSISFSFSNSQIIMSYVGTSVSLGSCIIKLLMAACAAWAWEHKQVEATLPSEGLFLISKIFQFLLIFPTSCFRSPSQLNPYMVSLKHKSRKRMHDLFTG